MQSIVNAALNTYIHIYSAHIHMVLDGNNLI